MRWWRQGAGVTSQKCGWKEKGGWELEGAEGLGLVEGRVFLL